MVIPTLRAIGNIVSGDDAHTQAVIDCGAVPRLLGLLTATGGHRRIVKEACWIVSNITAGTPQQIQTVVDAGVLPVIIHHMETGEFGIKKEATWAVSNAASGDTRHIEYMASHGAIRALCGVLRCHDARTVSVALDGLACFLEAGQARCNAAGDPNTRTSTHPSGANPFACMVEEAGGLDAIEAAHDHMNEDVSEKAAALIDTYFGME